MVFLNNVIVFYVKATLVKDHDWEFPGGPVANAGALGSNPGQGTRAHMPQLRVHLLQL